MIEVSMTRILVVDDSTFNLKIITASLTPSGYEVVTANNGREALDFSETTLAGLDMADQILAVLAPELAAVRAMSSALDVFTHLDYTRDRVALLLHATCERGA